MSEEYSGKTLEETHLEIPSIHNVFRWWRKDVLFHLLILKKSILNVKDKTIQDFFKLALSKALIPDLTNVTLGKLQLSFINRDEDEIKVWKVFESCSADAIEDLETLQGNKTSSEITLVDATTATNPNTPDVDLVITSPPYPNRYSYVWNTRPYLYFWNIFEGKTEAADLDKKTIGGTWGSATSCLKEGEVEIENIAVREVVDSVISKIRENDNLMANYVAKYFNLLSKQIENMIPRLKTGATIVYVVGNSEIKGVYVETDRLLAEAMNAMDLGLKVKVVERFRKRNSGVDLYESSVIAEYSSEKLD